MSILDLFNRLTEANFSFTKPCFESEKEFSKEQKRSLNKLIICGLAKEISKNTYSLSTDGRKASVLGIEKWAKSLSDIERCALVYDCFGYFNSWYNLPRLKIIIERSIKSRISNLAWNFIKFIIGAIILMFLKFIFDIIFKLE
jgi:hypothetical protein